MTKQINKTIRSLNVSLKILNDIHSNEFELWLNYPGYISINEMRNQTQLLINNLEEKYQEIHKVKGKL